MHSLWTRIKNRKDKGKYRFKAIWKHGNVHLRIYGSVVYTARTYVYENLYWRRATTKYQLPQLVMIGTIEDNGIAVRICFGQGKVQEAVC